MGNAVCWKHEQVRGCVQFCGNVRLPVSSAEFAIEDGQNMFAVGDGPLALHVEQTNLIFQL